MLGRLVHGGTPETGPSYAILQRVPQRPGFYRLTLTRV